VYQFIRDHGGFENWEIVLIEKAVDCSDKPTLHARERYWMERLQAELNKYIPTRTQKEWYEDNHTRLLNKAKEYNELNQDNIKEYKNFWYTLNQDKLREYRELNKDKKKDYNEQNRDKINKKRRETYALKKLNTLGSITQILT
jgi:hypothetical protein